MSRVELRECHPHGDMASILENTRVFDGPLTGIIIIKVCLDDDQRDFIRRHRIHEQVVVAARRFSNSAACYHDHEVKSICGASKQMLQVCSGIFSRYSASVVLVQSERVDNVIFNAVVFGVHYFRAGGRTHHTALSWLDPAI